MPRGSMQMLRAARANPENDGFIELGNDTRGKDTLLSSVQDRTRLAQHRFLLLTMHPWLMHPWLMHPG
jgi:hypothetical protein